MKDKLPLYLVVTLVVGILVGLALNNSRQANQYQSQSDQPGRANYGQGHNQAQTGQLNQANCLADDCLLVDDVEYPVGELPTEVQNALAEAINDEYKALSVYMTVIDKFGPTRPFSMIKGAEESHIASLKAIYDKYGLAVPANDWLGQIVAPATLQQACQTGVEAEIANAALYRDQLLPAVTEYEDISLVFENLMNASEQKHLPAFEKCN